MKEFHIRAYGRTELAQVYSPDLSSKGAYNRLMAWIHFNPELTARLKQLSNNPRSRIFTPAQVQAIVDILGEP